jgi:hypothetical protein
MRLQTFAAAFALAAFLAVASSPAWGQDGASWLRTRSASTVLNPNLSVIADFVGQAGPREDGDANRFALRETEIGLQAAVDPFARADFFVGLHEGESAELEEGYITLLALPWGLQARGGKFLPNVGRLNMVHNHELPQVDRPLVLRQFLGEEGLNETGLEASRIFAPFGLYTEVSFAVLNGLGGAHGHADEEDETVFVQARDENGNPLTDSGGNPVFREVPVHAADEEAPRTLRSFGHVARLRFYKDLTEAANIEWGVSGALHQPEAREQRRVGGADVTVRWRPPAQGLYRSFLWRTEVLASRRALEESLDAAGAVTAPARTLDRRGGYSYVEVQPARQWRFGVRSDYAEDPEAADEVFVLEDGSTRQVKRSITRALSPYVTFTMSEFSRLRAQVTAARLPSGEDEHRGFLQWTVVLGPHGAHPF